MFCQWTLQASPITNCVPPLWKLWDFNIFRPYYNQCHYCHLKFDVIGHLEDSLDDTMYIAIKQNLTTLLPELTKTIRKSKEERSSLDRIEHHMTQLSTQQRRKLYNLYKLDFELFGYDPGDALCKNEACIKAVNPLRLNRLTGEILVHQLNRWKICSPVKVFHLEIDQFWPFSAEYNSKFPITLHVAWYFTVI